MYLQPVPPTKRQSGAGVPRRRLGLWTWTLGFLLGLGLSPSPALGQTKPPDPKAKQAQPGRARSKPAARAKPALPTKVKQEPPKAGSREEPSAKKPPAAGPGDDSRQGGGESRLPAGTSTPEAGAGTRGSVKEKEDPEGVKTYQFGAIEVEGRLRSPQLIYFLRRVRAEFEADALGHRSFLGELSDTRNAAAFR